MYTLCAQPPRRLPAGDICHLYINALCFFEQGGLLIYTKELRRGVERRAFLSDPTHKHVLH